MENRRKTRVNMKGLEKGKKTRLLIKELKRALNTVEERKAAAAYVQRVNDSEKLAGLQTDIGLA